MKMTNGGGLKNSTRSSNPDGLLERDIKARNIKYEVPSHSYKKRRLNELSHNEVDNILSYYFTEPLTQD